MPSSSAAQARLMAAVAHGWKKPGGGPPREVAEEFNEADAGSGIRQRRPSPMADAMRRAKGQP